LLAVIVQLQRSGDGLAATVFRLLLLERVLLCRWKLFGVLRMRGWTDGLFVTRLVVMGVMIASVNTDVALTIVKNAMAKETANTNAAIVKHAWTARASLLVTVIATEIVSVVMNASIAGVHVPAGHVAILIVIHCTASAVMRIAIVNPSVTQIPRPAVTVLAIVNPSVTQIPRPAVTVLAVIRSGLKRHILQSTSLVLVLLNVKSRDATE